MRLMILTGPEIHHQRGIDRIKIEPYDPACVEPNSYKFHLGSRLAVYKERVLDSAKNSPLSVETISPEGVILYPNKLYLSETLECLGSDYYIPLLESRRSTATLGLYIQFSAPLGHLGSKIAWTLEMRTLHPLVLYQGMPIGKISFWVPDGSLQMYRGKYCESTCVEGSSLYKEAPLINRK